MGRGRKSVIAQGNTSKKKSRGELPMVERNTFSFGLKPPNQTIVDIPEEVLNKLRKMNPRDIVNIIVNP